VHTHTRRDGGKGCVPRRLSRGAPELNEPSETEFSGKLLYDPVAFTGGALKLLPIDNLYGATLGFDRSPFLQNRGRIAYRGTIGSEDRR